ncbi:hypothetical protein KR054_009107 [Drosophila jambulina]|nr:hypothetical protein KR054_009107 [Drosophila jambulina]
MDFEFTTPPPEERVIRPHNLDAEQLKDLQKAFSLFDDADNKVIPINHLKHLMRSVACHPTELELQHILNEIDPEGAGELHLSDFLYIMSQKYATMTPEDEIIGAFRVFDKQGTGFISEKEFRHIMKNLGEHMTDDEVDEIVLDADANVEGNINYASFVAMMSET